MNTFPSQVKLASNVDQPLVLVALPSADAKELKPCREMGHKSTWLTHEQIVSDARKAIPSLPDESWTMIIEEWGKFPRGAIAVIPPVGKKGKFAISTESVEITNPARFRDR